MKLKYIMLPLLLFAFITPLFVGQTVHAEEGDLYDRHQDLFEEHRWWNDNYQDMIEEYDYENNEFNCGNALFNFDCNLNATLLTMLIGIIKAVLSGTETAVVTGNDIVGSDLFRPYHLSLERLSVTMLSIFIMWNVVKIVAMRFADQDDGMLALNEKLVKVLAMGILLGIYPSFFNWVMRLQSTAVEAVMQEGIDNEMVIVSLFIRGGSHGLVIAFIVALVVFVFAIAFMYRFVLFGMLYITGVIAIPTGINDEYNYFSLWLRLLITNGITLFLQSIAYTLGVNSFFTFEDLNSNLNFVTGLAFFILALVIPSLLGQLGQSSGTGKALGSIVRVASRRMR